MSKTDGKTCTFCGRIRPQHAEGCRSEENERRRVLAILEAARSAQVAAAMQKVDERVILVRPCEIKLIGETDRLISEMKYVLDHPGEYDQPTFQTLKHHIEDLELFIAYAKGRLVDIKAKSLPPVAVQIERGY